MKNTLMIFFILAIVSCGDGKDRETIFFEYGSLDSCLTDIRAKSGESLDIVTDKPGTVSGYLSKTGGQFGCNQDESGTRGVYYRGYYQKTLPN